MTLRDFAFKYNLPFSQVKSAMHVPTRIKDIKIANAKMHMNYEEESLVVEMTAYYLSDMRFCIERANKDNEALKRLAENAEGR